MNLIVCICYLRSEQSIILLCDYIIRNKLHPETLIIIVYEGKIFFHFKAFSSRKYLKKLMISGHHPLTLVSSNLRWHMTTCNLQNNLEGSLKTSWHCRVSVQKFWLGLMVMDVSPRYLYPPTLYTSWTQRLLDCCCCFAWTSTFDSAVRLTWISK